MATRSDIQFFDQVVATETLLVDIAPLLAVIRPLWKQEHVLTETFSKGFVNSMTCLYQKDDPDRTDALVVRIYGLENQGLDEVIVRSNEFMCMQLAQTVGCFQPIYAAFSNGVVYQYAKGRTLTYHDLTDPRVIRKITKKLYAFHQINVDEVPLVDRKGNPATFSKDDKSFRVQGFMAAIPEKATDPEKDVSFQEIRKELNDDFIKTEFTIIKEVFDEIKLPVSLAHNDFHVRNMLLNDDTGDITFLDYEVSAFNKTCYDLAALVIMRPFLDQAGTTSADEPQLTPGLQRLWLRSYLEAKHESLGGSCDDVTDDELDMIDVERQLIEILILFDMCVSSLSFVNVPLDLDILGMVPMATRLYYERRGRLLELKEEYLKLRESPQTKC